MPSSVSSADASACDQLPVSSADQGTGMPFPSVRVSTRTVTSSPSSPALSNIYASVCSAMIEAMASVCVSASSSCRSSTAAW